MALFILDKYATDPDFREILRSLGGAIIPPIAQADTGPEALAVLQSKDRRSFSEALAKMALLASGDNGQAVIRTIKQDGLERVADLNRGEIRFYQFLPLYDVLHLGNVLSRGHSPTSGEMTWAVVDGCFVIADVLSLAAIQPEGAVAAEAVRSEVKAAAREGTGRPAESSQRPAANRRGRAWHSHGPRGAPRRRRNSRGRSCLAQGRPLVGRPLRGRSLSGPATSSRRPAPHEPDPGGRDGQAALRQGRHQTQLMEADSAPQGRRGHSAPDPSRAGPEVPGGAVLQASVGVVGFQKMEEHLSSRRPKSL